MTPGLLAEPGDGSHMKILHRGPGTETRPGERTVSLAIGRCDASVNPMVGAWELPTIRYSSELDKRYPKILSLPQEILSTRPR